MGTHVILFMGLLVLLSVVHSAPTNSNPPTPIIESGGQTAGTKTNTAETLPTISPEVATEEEVSYQWLIGALLSIVGSVCSNLGVNTQKWSFNANDKKPKESQRVYFKQPAWVVGLLLVIAGSLGDFAALGLAAQSIVAPVGAVTLVANIVFAHFWLTEPLFAKDLLGTLCIITGSILAVSFGSHEEKVVTLEILMDNFEQTGFIVYAIVVAVSVITMYALLKIIEPIRNDMGEKVKAYEDAREAKDKELYTKLEAEIDEIQEKYSKWERLHPFLYCATSGVCGGQNILFGKCVAEMISASIQGNNQMDNFLTWVFVACMLTSIFTQLHFLALALTYFDALYVVPVFQCFFITVSTLGGAAYFQEFASFELVQGIMFPTGIVLTLAGVYLLSSRKMGTDIDRSLQSFTEAEGLTAGMHDVTDPAATEGDTNPDDVQLDLDKILTQVDENKTDVETPKTDVKTPETPKAETPQGENDTDSADGGDTFQIAPALQVSAIRARLGRAQTLGDATRPRVASLARKSYNPRVSIMMPANPVSRVSANLARISAVSNNPNRRVNRLSVFSLGGVV